MAVRTFHGVQKRSVSQFLWSGFVGLGPADLRPDDQSVLPYRSCFPKAIRRSSETGNWQFQGFVYARGIMDDELRDCLRDIELNEREFVWDRRTYN